MLPILTPEQPAPQRPRRFNEPLPRKTGLKFQPIHWTFTDLSRLYFEKYYSTISKKK